MLQQKNLAVRRAVPKDAPLLAAWWNDGRLMAHAGFPNGTGQTAAQVEEELRSDAGRRRCRLILEKDQMPVGEMICFATEEKGTVGIGIKIGVEHQNQGMGKRYLSLVLAALFAGGCQKVILDTDIENRRAQHVYEALGFRRRTVCPDAFRDPSGRLHTTIVYFLRPTDFIAWS